jgi:hypothetical protein
MENVKITTLADLEQYAEGEAVELPSFAAGKPFVAMLKRPSMLALARAGKIPNSLLTKANKLFADGIGSFDEEDENAMKDMFTLMDAICEASFVQPSYDEIVKSKVQLTDEQYMFVFNYSQRGVKALESFRGERGDNEDNRSGEVVQFTAQPIDGDN